MPDEGQPRQTLAGRFAMLEGLSPEQVRAVVGITIVSFAITVGIGAIFPLVPIFARELGISLTAVGVLVSAFGVARIPVGLAGGWLFARFSERVVGSAGAGTVALGSLITASASSFQALFVARVVHGIGVSLFISAGLVYLGRTVAPDRRGRLMSLQQGALIMGTSVGPVVGALLASVGSIRTPFLAAALVGLGACVFSIRSFPSSGVRVAEVRRGSRSGPVGLRWTFVVVLVCSFVTWAMRSAMRFTITPIFIDEQLGASLAWSGAVLALMSTGDLVGLAFGGRWMDRWGRRSVLTWGFLGTAAVIGAFAVVHSIGGLVVVAVAFGLTGGVGAAAPAAMAADLAAGRAGLVSQVRMAGDLGTLLAPLAATMVLDHGGFALGYLAVAALTLLGAVLAWSGRETGGVIVPSSGKTGAS